MTEHRGSDIPVATGAVEQLPETTERSKRVRILTPLGAPYPERKVRDVPQLREIWEYINPQMLYVRHLGFKSNFEKALAARDPKALELHNLVEEVQAEAAKFMKVKAVWQFFDAEAEGNSIKLFSHHEGTKSTKPDHVFHFHRQRKPDGLCLSDYVNPPRDSVALFVVGAGTGIRQRAEEYKAKGEYLKSHALQALVHRDRRRLRRMAAQAYPRRLGFPRPPPT